MPFTVKSVAAAALVAAAAVGDGAAAAATQEFETEKLVFSFSGGGARAALGTMEALEVFENIADLGRNTESINGLSGGSWGSTLFHFNEFGDSMLDKAVHQSSATREVKHGKFFWKSTKTEWAALKHFNRGTVAAGKVSSSKQAKAYTNWRKDIQETIFGDAHDLTKTWAEVGAKIKKTYQHKLCSFFSDGKPSDPAYTCKWCAGDDAVCFKNDGSGDRRTLDLTKKATIASKIVRPNGLDAADVMDVTSSAWTYITGPLKIKLEGQGAGNEVVELKVSDAGIDCNVPFDPEWAKPLPAKTRRTVFLFDFSDDSSVKGEGFLASKKPTPGASLKNCLAKWKKRHSLDFTEVVLSTRSTRVNTDGTLADQQQRTANKNAARTGLAGHKAESHIKQLKLGGRADLDVFWIQFRTIESSTDLMKSHNTVNSLGWPESYSMDKVKDIRTKYRTFLTDHVQTFVGKRLTKSGGPSVVGISKLFEEEE